jgi:lipopolysaccharide/colanic/teichoic acid biosynthesis glycosyltransferase
MAKRAFDIIVSSIFLLIFAPFFLIIAILIKKGSEGPVFYRGERVGRYGKLFRIFKFRTMVSNAEKIGGSSTSNDDHRITAIGKTLRKYKLDEFPQFINVFLGQMSLVGPRPEVKKFVDIYTSQERAILSVRPGITDWASIWNSDEGAILAGAEDPDKAYMELIRPEKIRLQLKYVENRSFLIDLKILFQTVTKLLKQGAETTQAKRATSKTPSEV